MNAQDAMIETAYDDLIRCYSAEHSCVFLQSSWLLNENASFLTKSFSRMIFSDGNSHEVYTKRERDFITRINSEVDYFRYQKQSKQGTIDCRMLSVDFSFSADPLYDGIEFMKIFNKAFDGFNIFLFVCDNGLYIGCSCIKSSELARDCVISPLITPKINWESFGNELLCRNDSSDFYEYYSGIVNIINEIQYCFDCEPDERYPAFYFNNDCDDDPADDLCKIPIDEYFSFKNKEQSSKTCNSFDKTFFNSELEWCFDDLEFIKSSRVNPLEMLFEAEKALEQSNNTEQQHTNSPDSLLATSKQFSTNENFELLNDPIALMKILKQERGI
jgi:hypothetical protein